MPPTARASLGDDAREGERKPVSVLFVGISESTSVSERFDAEEVHRLMNRTFDLMLAEVHRYEGTVNQFLGDGIMAQFGVPIAHEDHARRAVHALLADAPERTLQLARGDDSRAAATGEPTGRAREPAAAHDGHEGLDVVEFHGHDNN